MYKTINVGLKSGDIIGNTNWELQTAIDYLSSSGGGTVNIPAGEFFMYDSLHMKSNITIQGAGMDTVLKKAKSTEYVLTADAERGDQQLKVASTKGLREGFGIAIFDNHHNTDFFSVEIVTIIKIVDSNTFIIDQPLKYPHCISQNTAVTTSYPVICARECTHSAIKDIYIDGNRKENDIFLNGCVSGGIYLNQSTNFLIKNCVVSDYNGDGISFQKSSHYVSIMESTARGNAGWGFHPGTQSSHMLIRDSSGIHNDSMGIYICWDVRHGRIENCDFSYNGDTGLDIGHGDTDNRITGNRICGNKHMGIHIRTETEEFAPHRTLIEANGIFDNGRGEGPSVGIQINGDVCDVAIKNNKIGNMKTKDQEYGISIGKNVRDLILEGNEFIGNKTEDIFYSASI